MPGICPYYKGNMCIHLVLVCVPKMEELGFPVILGNEQIHRSTGALKSYGNFRDCFEDFTLQCIIAQLVSTCLTPPVRAIEILHVQPKGKRIWTTGNFLPCLLEEGSVPQEAFSNPLLTEVLSKMGIQVLPDLILQRKRQMSLQLLLSTKTVFADSVNKQECMTFQRNLIRTVLSLAEVDFLHSS